MSFIPAAFAAVGKAVSSIGLGTAASVASTAVAGITAYQQQRYQAAVAEQNKRQAEFNATAALGSGQQAAEDQDAMTLAAIGQQLSIQSASGLSTRSRSNVMTRKSARELGRKDALNVNQAGRLQANSFLTQGQNFGSEAAAARSGASGSLLNAFLTTGSLLGKSRSVRNSEKFNPRPYGAPTSLI